jgi:hypothetical protein
MKGPHIVGFWGMTSVLIFVGGIGTGLIWLGLGLWRNVRATKDGIPANAVIDKLEYSGNYLTGRFFARISFTDATGARLSTHLSLAPAVWNRMREGGPLRILYSAADPRNVSLGGPGFRDLSRLAGIAFMAIGAVIAAVALYILIGGLSGWIEVDGLRPRQGWQVPLPAPAPK